MHQSGSLGMKQIILILFVLLLLPSCFTLRNKYPTILYYYLKQEPFSFRNIAKMDVLLGYEDFDFPTEILSTNQLQIKYPGNIIQKYFYHRWAESPDRLIMDFIIQRLNLANAFSGGVVKLNASISPRFILKGQVLDFSAYNNEEKSDGNYVLLTIRIWIVEWIPLSAENKIIFENTYSFRQSRTNNSVESIAPAFSRALSSLIDKMIFDLQSALVEVD